MIGKIAALVVLGLSAVVGVYNAGKYANGGSTLHKGGIAAASSAINAVICGLIFVALYLDY